MTKPVAEPTNRDDRNEPVSQPVSPGSGGIEPVAALVATPERGGVVEWLENRRRTVARPARAAAISLGKPGEQVATQNDSEV